MGHLVRRRHGRADAARLGGARWRHGRARRANRGRAGSGNRTDHVGGRSARVAEALVAAGYDAANVAGGAEAWQEAGLPIVASDGQPGTVA